MLHPEMKEEKLLQWAETEGLLEELQIPAKMLSVSNSKYYSAWLWRFHQSNISLQEIITRPTALSLEELNETTAPLEYQQAAISFLYERGKDKIQALEDEQQLFTLVPPENPVLRKIWQNLWEARKEIRQAASPKTKKSRHTGRLIFDPTHLCLKYKEESFSWCGDSQWPEITISLHNSSKRVFCNCLSGNIGRCSRLLSAIDHCLETLSNPAYTPLHEKIINRVSKPQWMIHLEEIDKTLEDQATIKPEEMLGWRLKTNKDYYISLEPVWCSSSKNGWKHRKADFVDIHKTSPKKEDIDDTVIHLLELVNSSRHSLQKSQKQNLYHQAISLLIGHPRVFYGSKSKQTLIVRKANIQISLEQTNIGIQLDLYLQNQQLHLHDFQKDINFIHGNILLKVTETHCDVIIISDKKQALIEPLLQQKIFPSDAAKALFKRFSSIQKYFPIQIGKSLRGQEQRLNTIPSLYLELNSNSILHISAKIQPLVNHEPLEIAAGQKELYIWQEEQCLFGNRDFKKEQQELSSLLHRLDLDYNDAKKWTIESEDEIFLLLQKLKLETNTQIFWHSKPHTLFHIDNIKDFKIDIFNKDQVFNIDGYIELRKEKLSIFTILSAIRQEKKFLLVQNNQWISLSEQLKKRFLLLADTLVPQEESLLFFPEHIPQIQEAIPEALETQPELFNYQLLDNSITWKGNFGYQLRNYQKEGVIWIMQMQQKLSGAILADEMGLGKMIQTLAFLHQSQPQKAVIIISPKSILPTWYEEIQKTLPNYNPIYYSGKERETILLNLKDKDILISSYAIVSRDIEMLSQKDFSVAIFDEAQALKNPDTDRSKAAYLLPASFKLLLSGTPIENNISDLWSLFRISLPKLLGSWQQFHFRFSLPIQSGNHARLKALTHLISPFILRRKKELVATDLPPKIEINEMISLSDIEMEHYQEIKNEALQILTKESSHIQILATITKLRQLSCHRALVHSTAGSFSSKLNRAIELMELFRQEKKKVLIFSQFVGLLELLKKQVELHHWKYSYLTGSSSIKNREEQIKTFIEDNSCSFFLISLKAGGVGLNLSAATEVIHLDPWWNPAFEDQASDRAHRIGQTKTVTIIRLITRNTIEEKILALHQKKRDLAENILSSNESISTSELFSLLYDE